MTVRDFNRDGILDLAVVYGYGMVNLLLGNGDGTFQAPQSYPSGYPSVSVAVEDFNGDGYPDLAVANPDYTSTVTILLNDGH